MTSRVQARPRISPVAFPAVAAAVYLTALALADVLPRLDRPNAVATGMAIDLVVVVPLAFYFLVIRPRGLPITALVPVIALGFVGESWILPRDHRQALHLLEALAAPLELGLLSWIAWRAARAMLAAHRASADPFDALYRAAFEVTPEGFARALGWARRAEAGAPR